MSRANYLEKTYNNAVKIAKFSLIQYFELNEYKNIKTTPIEFKEIFWRKLIRLKVHINCEDIYLIVAFKMNFPDSFPVIFLDESTPDIYKNIPHCDKDLQICTYDKITTKYNPNDPGNFVLDVINKAIENIKKGILNKNLDDYDDEFYAYWNQDALIRVISIINPEDNIKHLKLFRFKKPWKKYYYYLVADSYLEGIEWLANNGFSKKEIKTIDNKESLYLPINSFGYPPFPKTYNELNNCLKENDPHCLDGLYKYLSTVQRPSFIVFSIKRSDDYIFGAWEHKNYSHIEKTGCLYKSRNPGFRDNRIPPDLELTKFAKDIIIKKYTVERFDKARVLKRSKGSGYSKDNNIQLIGCGSIGSFLLESLVYSGFNNLSLVDPENLSSENIGRHICGIDSLNEAKVNELKKKFDSRFAYLDIKTQKMSLETLLLKNIEIFNDYDLSIINIAHLSMELRVNELYKKKLINTPILFVWVEPYLKAGFALVLLPNKQGCLKCLFDDQLNFKYRYFTQGIFHKRESGCQSTYIPYGSLDIQLFTNMVSRFILKIDNGEIQDNTLFTWLGETNNIIDETFEVNTIWNDKRAFSEHYIKIANLDSCNLCRDYEI